jgi:hypothetical protein
MTKASKMPQDDLRVYRLSPRVENQNSNRFQKNSNGFKNLSLSAKARRGGAL